MSVAHHTLDIYGAEIHLATTKRDWSTLRRKLDFLDRAAPESAGLATFATFHPKGGGLTVPHLVLWLDVAMHQTHLDLIDTCAHEASHAVSQLFEWIGHTPTGVDEPSAYFVGWLTRWMLEQVGDVA